MFNVISGNFKISKQQIAELKKEINELRQTIEHTENVLEDKVARVEENLGYIESRVQEIYDYQLDPAFTKDKLTDRSRRNNLRVDGIKERPNETWEGCEKELHTLFKESLGIEHYYYYYNFFSVIYKFTENSFAKELVITRMLLI